MYFLKLSHENDYFHCKWYQANQYLWCGIRKPTLHKKIWKYVSLQIRVEVVLLFHLRPLILLATWTYSEYENTDKRFTSFTSHVCISDVKIEKFFLSIPIDTFWFLSIIIDIKFGKKNYYLKKAPTTVQICKLENIEHKSMK